MPPESIGCREVTDRITLYLEEALSDFERERFEAHCRVCPACRARLAQTRALVESLGRLGERREGPTSAEKERILAVFREHGLHRPGPRPRRVPLGLAGAAVAPGDHLACLWESDEEYLSSFGFLVAGMGNGETCLLVGHEEDNQRAEAGLERAGLDPAAMRRQGRIHLVSRDDSIDALLEEIGERVKAAVDRGEPLVRIFGNLGWGRRGGLSERDHLRLEARVTDAIRNLPAVVMCAYDAQGVTWRNVHPSGLSCHPWTLHRNSLRPNDRYVPSEPFLAALEGERS